MMWWGSDGWSWGDWLAMSLMMVAFWALVVFAIVALVRSRHEHDGVRDGRKPADILAERFARGEIDEAEFDQRAEALGRRGRS